MSKYYREEDLREELSNVELHYDLLADLPTIEIIECKDCLDNDINCSGTENWCLKFGYECEDDDWCNHGVRCDK